MLVARGTSPVIEGLELSVQGGERGWRLSWSLKDNDLINLDYTTMLPWKSPKYMVQRISRLLTRCGSREGCAPQEGGKLHTPFLHPLPCSSLQLHNLVNKVFLHVPWAGWANGQTQGGSPRNLQFITSWSETQVTTWTFDTWRGAVWEVGHRWIVSPSNRTVH